jgi:hypothetical protein
MIPQTIQVNAIGYEVLSDVRRRLEDDLDVYILLRGRNLAALVRFAHACGAVSRVCRDRWGAPPHAENATAWAQARKPIRCFAPVELSDEDLAGEGENNSELAMVRSLRQTGEARQSTSIKACKDAYYTQAKNCVRSQLRKGK